jgi:phytanoyl-CoA hydroxylase
MSTLDSVFSTNWYDKSTCFDSDIFKNSPEKYKKNLVQFVNDGYTILEGAIPKNTIDKYLKSLSRDIDTGKYFSYGSEITQTYSKSDLLKPLTKLLDPHSYNKFARDIIFHQSITEFTDLLWASPILCFQTLHFEVGSTQQIHQDTAYVVLSNPLDLCAAWIALEDISEGSGELIYYPGSHRFEDFLYSNHFKHWSIERDGNDLHTHHLHWLNMEATKRNIPKKSFIAKKGDVLIWHADLAHGGSPIIKEHVTRRSLVAHFTKATQTPHYFGFLEPEKQTKIKYLKNYVSSFYY